MLWSMGYVGRASCFVWRGRSNRSTYLFRPTISVCFSHVQGRQGTQAKAWLRIMCYIISTVIRINQNLYSMKHGRHRDSSMCFLSNLLVSTACICQNFSCFSFVWKQLLHLEEVRWGERSSFDQTAFTIVTALQKIKLIAQSLYWFWRKSLINQRLKKKKRFGKSNGIFRW